MTQFLRTPWTLVSTVAAMAVLVSACGKGHQASGPAVPDAPASPAVAIVNGTPISRSEFDVYVKLLQQGKPQTTLTPAQQGQVLDEMITMQLVSAQAVKDGVDKEPEVAGRLGILRMRVLADAESQKYLRGKEPTDAELHAEYDTAIASMDKTEYHARHILVDSKEKGEAIIKKLKGGAKFDELAKTESSDGSKSNGGDLGWFTLARMVKPFGDAVKSLKKGEITPEPVQTQFGWHVIQLEDTRDVAPPPFEQVKAQVGNGVIQKKLQVYVDELKKNAKIEKKLDASSTPPSGPASAPAG
jgi:peptidyl-prolyl cis-trans isomerase C